MESARVQNSPPFHYILRASGQGEVWHDFTEEAKFRQYGWRCSTNEDTYSTATLIGNWYEKTFDIRRAKALQRPLPSQFSHYFETTYSSAYNKEDSRPIYRTLKREPRSFPGHQPELDPPHTKCVPNSSYRQDFSRYGASGIGQTSARNPGATFAAEEPASRSQSHSRLELPFCFLRQYDVHEALL